MVKKVNATTTVCNQIADKLWKAQVGFCLISLLTTRRAKITKKGNDLAECSFVNICGIGTDDSYGVVQISDTTNNLITISIYWNKKPSQFFMYNKSEDTLI